MYYVYILANKRRNVLYVGVTNDLVRRLHEHVSKLNTESFASKYNATDLLHFECCDDVLTAISREKEIKGWRRSKKDALINSANPEWKTLNNEILC
jgi:putative endonuclease